MYNLEVMKMMVRPKLEEYVREHRTDRIMKLKNNSKNNSRDDFFLCPFCGKEENSRLNLRIPADDSEHYICTDCNRSGDIFDMFKFYEGERSDREIAEILIDRYNLNPILSNLSFNYTSAKTLYNDKISLPDFIVTSLIPKGLSVLSGNVKCGKTWLALWICIQVAKGEKVWDYDMDCGTTLYISLDDNQTRLQNRLKVITDESPENMFVTTTAKTIDSGLIAQIKNFIDEYNDTKLIVIDTLQNICNGENDIVKNYGNLLQLKEIANMNNIAILLLHDIKTARDDSANDKFLSSPELMSAADTVLMLAKDYTSNNKSTLFVTGNDILDQKLILEFDDGHWYQAVKDAEQKQTTFESSTISTAVIQFVKDNGSWEGTATNLIENLKKYSPDINSQANKFSRELFSFKEELLQQGVEIGKKVVNGQRLICISLSTPSL